MRKLILSVHVTLDGYMAGPGGEMDMFKLDNEMFELVGKFTDNADLALYGRNTFEMMDSYWPMAADKPGATKHDREHSEWYNRVDKIVLSKTMQNKGSGKIRFISDDIFGEVSRIKNLEGKNILIFGSPTATHTLMKYNLIDDYWLFINPVILGKGIPLFDGLENKIMLRHERTVVFPCGVTGIHFEVER